MNNKVKYDGKELHIDDEVVLEKIHIKIIGKSNYINIEPIKGNGALYVEINGNNNKLNIGKNNKINNNMFIYYPSAEETDVENVEVSIGDNNIFNGNNIIIIAPSKSGNILKIGSQNMVAGNVYIRGRNDHVIYNIKTQKIISEKEVFIGDKNWICDNVQILPKTKITNSNIIGLGSIVNSEFKKENTLIAGSPAKVKKKNIMWSIVTKDASKIDFINPTQYLQD